MIPRIPRKAFYFIFKILRALITAFAIVVLSFFMVRASGDPARIYLGSEATPEMIEHFNHKWGLDRSLPVQFASYLSRLFQGDLGDSLIKSRPAIEIILERVPATLSLMIPAALISIIGGITLGMAASRNGGSHLDSGLMLLSTIGYSLPNFFFGVVLIFFFSIILGSLPSSGNETWKHFLMPITTIAAADIAVFTRFSRAAFNDIYEQGFITSFRALGIAERRILFLHALPNASISLLTISGFYVGSLITGAIVTETIFSWPGLGSLLISSLKARDFPLVQGLILIFGLSIVAVNLVIDMLYGIFDPRVREGINA